MNVWKCALVVLAVAVAAAASPADDSALLKKGSRVVIIGDSITEQKLYSRYMEAYLLMCQSQLDLNVLQLGWSGETAGGFIGRMDFDLLWFKPNVITTCYGMNDGSYRPFDKVIGDAYRKNMNTIITKAKAAGIFAVVGSPGAVDTRFFGKNGERAGMYNDNLSHLRDIAKELAKEHGMAFANVHDAMYLTMPKAKEKLGQDYPVCGGDGFHPGPNGQLLMAYAFLKALNLDGQIATITVDLDGSATASAGHTVVASKGGQVELESTRYPFCFSGDTKSANSPRSILPFIPFQQDLNRFTLRVKGLKSEKAKVTWGKATMSFTRAQLEEGVNLAAEFPETPFSGAFQKVDQLIGAKQNFETQMIKSHHVGLRGLGAAAAQDAEIKGAVELIASRLHEGHAKMAATVRAAITPVKHTLVVTPE